MRFSSLSLLLTAAFLALGCTSSPNNLDLTMTAQESGTSARLIGLDPAGIAYRREDDGNWTMATDHSHWSVAFAGPRAGWAVGPNGRITKLTFK